MYINRLGNKMLLVCSITAILFACDKNNDKKPAVAYVYPYSNPLTDVSMPDPSVWKENDTSYFVYATNTSKIKKSKDMIHWEDGGVMFTTKPSFVTTSGAAMWAPDIEKVGDNYVLYYSMSAWGGGSTAGIGTAYASTPEGPFKLDKSVDGKGKLFTSGEIGVPNSIDPCFFEENGEKWMFWGSFNGLWGVRLSDDGMRLAEPLATAKANKVKIAGTAFEGAYIHKRGSYYYLFASIGGCCDAMLSTYTTVVGRSTALTGPYLTKNGDSLLNNNYEIVIKSNDKFVGPGHNSEIITDKKGTDWLFYHSYDRRTPKLGRYLMVDKINWVNDWPEVEGKVPSSVAEAPVCK